MGRPTSLTPEIVEEVGRLIPILLHMQSVAAALGVPKSTFYAWIKRGRQEEKRLQHPNQQPLETEAIYLALLDAYKRGLAEGERQDQERIIAAAQSGSWQASAWRLERRFPERWGSYRRELRELQEQVRRLEAAIRERGAQEASAPD